MQNPVLFTKARFAKETINRHTDPLFEQSSILKLSDLYQLQVLLFMHKYSHDKLPMSFRNTFTLNRDINVVHETRQVNMYHVIKSKCKFIDKLPLFQFPCCGMKHSDGLCERIVYRAVIAARLNVSQRSWISVCMNRSSRGVIVSPLNGQFDWILHVKHLTFFYMIHLVFFVCCCQARIMWI